MTWDRKTALHKAHCFSWLNWNMEEVGTAGIASSPATAQLSGLIPHSFQPSLFSKSGCFQPGCLMVSWEDARSLGLEMEVTPRTTPPSSTPPARQLTPGVLEARQALGNSRGGRRRAAAEEGVHGQNLGRGKKQTLRSHRVEGPKKEPPNCLPKTTNMGNQTRKVTKVHELRK